LIYNILNMLDKDGLNWEISVGVTFSSLMGAVSLFFTGVLISQYHSFDSSIKVPLLFLIISTFSFIFSATIYSNAGTEVTLNKLKVVEKYMIYAKNITEFLGLYPLILSMPLVIGAVTQDNFLRTATTVVALIGMALYSQSKFSVLDKQLPSEEKRIYTTIFVILALVLYTTQYVTSANSLFSYSNIGIVLLLCLLTPAVYFSTKSKQYKVIRVRPFKETDAAMLSQMVRGNLAKYVAKHPDITIDTIENNYSEEAIRKIAKDHKVLVALFGGKPSGLISINDNMISAVFTDTSLHRKGLGRMLVESSETELGNNGFDHIKVHSGQNEIKFYEKMGFELVKKYPDGRAELRKEL
jgi:GNAT superfamily N-acetyltransferase